MPILYDLTAVQETRCEHIFLSSGPVRCHDPCIRWSEEIRDSVLPVKNVGRVEWMSEWAQFQVALVFVNDLLAILDEFDFWTSGLLSPADRDNKRHGKGQTVPMKVPYNLENL